ncbi:MAG: choice-of-anchor J domain-containing protein, partial [Bacteroidales bacterium]|nr:choice-of-anchor J domain-containing protein [Bacteroidales bacterium]
KTLLLALCLFGLVTINAQETTFFYDFNDNEFTGWQGYDADGDGYNWELHATTISGGMDGTYGVYSSCYMSGELTPENYLFTTESYLITETSQLHFFHCQSDMVYFEENFGVIVSEDGINFLVIWSKRYKEPYPDGQWGEEFVDLSEFAGKNMYIGFLHYECSGATANGIRIDNVELTSVESVAENEISFNVYPNPVENQLLIETEKEITNITIFTVNGVMMYEGKYNEEGIDISGLNAGVYFVKVAIDNHEIIEKIIKK